MYIAMNRFKVLPGSETAFEDVWKGRDSNLKSVPGFVEFHMLKGPKNDEHTLYSSHTVWNSHDAFDAWTKSQAFRDSHKNAGKNGVLYDGHPQFEGFEVIQTMTL
ncbi:MAG: antibiotic biosynthesis monooxygenase [Rhodobacteraceae bacterium]|nr:antibiotic biosynthesis monooxygenase [Paracoccaceae bacterium]